MEGHLHNSPVLCVHDEAIPLSLFCVLDEAIFFKMVGHLRAGSYFVPA